MKLRLLDLLVCPIDKTPLQVIEWESIDHHLDNDEIERAKRIGLDPRLFSREIITGLLFNPVRKYYYPIYRGVPRLMVFKTGFMNTFLGLYGNRLKEEFPDFLPAEDRAMPGEEDVLRTFSSEWLSYDWNNKVYWNLTAKEMFKCMRFLIDLENRPVKDQLVLEVGIGIGGIADYMAKHEKCELVGFDLGYSVDVAYKHFSKQKFLHIVQASVFSFAIQRGNI